MSNKQSTIAHILRWEGGWANDPDDAGGATMQGVTIGTFRSVFGQDKTEKDLRNITREQWETIFTKYFWSPWKADRIDNASVATLLVDFGWGSGVITSVKKVQSLLGVTADGRVGPQTLAAINGRDQRKLYDDLVAMRRQWLNAIVRARPANQKFIKGWINRLESIKFTNN